MTGVSEHSIDLVSRARSRLTSERDCSYTGELVAQESPESEYVHVSAPEMLLRSVASVSIPAQARLVYSFMMDG